MDGETPKEKIDETVRETAQQENEAQVVQLPEISPTVKAREDKPEGGKPKSKKSSSKNAGSGANLPKKESKTAPKSPDALSNPYFFPSALPPTAPPPATPSTPAPSFPPTSSLPPTWQGEDKGMEDKNSQPPVPVMDSLLDEVELPSKEKKKGEEVAMVPLDSTTDCCAPPCVTLPCGVGAGNGIMNMVTNFPCGSYFPGRVLMNKRNPFKHNPPLPEEGRGRVSQPSSLVDYIINLREDLADFQECHGLPRSRDYSFVSLGLALAQESIRAILSIICIVTELFPILAILSLILRFALDKLIDILQTSDSSIKMKKIVIFTIEMLMILIPLWLLVGIIFMPLITLIFSVFRGLFQFKKGTGSESRPRLISDGCSGDC